MLPSGAQPTAIGGTVKPVVPNGRLASTSAATLPDMIDLPGTGDVRQCIRCLLLSAQIIAHEPIARATPRWSQAGSALPRAIINPNADGTGGLPSRPV
jgi:hypothetical protein